MNELIAEYKAGGGEKTRVFFNATTRRYVVEWVNRFGTVYDYVVVNAANDAARLIFRDEWAPAADCPEQWPVKFFIRRAKAGIAVIDHAREHGL